MSYNFVLSGSQLNLQNDLTDYYEKLTNIYKIIKMDFVPVVFTEILTIARFWEYA